MNNFIANLEKFFLHLNKLIATFLPSQRKMRQFFIKFALVMAIFVPIVFATTQSEMPTKFLGSWSVDHSENFDEYLEAKGYGWFMRQVVKLASITKIFTKNPDGTYGCKIETSKNSVDWPKFRLGEEFQALYLDDAQHKILFTYDPAEDALVEKHTKVDAPDEQPDVYKYVIDSEGWLVMHMEYNGVKTKRFYKKNN